MFKLGFHNDQVARNTNSEADKACQGKDATFLMESIEARKVFIIQALDLSNFRYSTTPSTSPGPPALEQSLGKCLV